jgi:hypothetical protein
VFWVLLVAGWGAVWWGIHPAVSGVGGYLPTLYGAYARRELQLLALDDLSDEPTTPVTFLEASYANGGAQEVAAAFADWERWCDEVSDTTPPTRCWPCSVPGSRASTGSPGSRW